MMTAWRDENHKLQFSPMCHAHKAGLRRRDIILDVDGEDWQNESGFVAYILQRTKPAQEITLTVLCDGEQHRIRYPVKAISRGH